MNIFYLDESPIKAAQYQYDKHVVKMILESAQLLSSAHHILDGENTNIYKLTHKNHPDSIWVRSSKYNYIWLLNHLKALLSEYTFRYNKIHKTSRILEFLNIPKNIANNEFTPPPLCMDNIYQLDDAIESYRKYYKEGKSHLAKWTKREKPYWY